MSTCESPSCSCQPPAMRSEPTPRSDSLTQPAGPRSSIIPVTFVLHPGKVLRCLAVIIGFLTAANIARIIAVHALGYRTILGLNQLFDVDGEGNIPSMYSALALLFAGLLLAVIARAESLAGGQGPRAWGGLAVMFVYLSIDEFSQIHEIVNNVAHYFAKPTGIFYFAWVIPALAFVAALGLIYVKFILKLPARIRLLAIVSAIVFLSGAIGCEMVGSRIFEQHGEEACRLLSRLPSRNSSRCAESRCGSTPCCSTSRTTPGRLPNCEFLVPARTQTEKRPQRTMARHFAAPKACSSARAELSCAFHPGLGSVGDAPAPRIRWRSTV